MRTDAVYTPTNVFEPFPFPVAAEADEALGMLGQSYDTFRTELMRATQIGLTKLYNRFHDLDCTDPRIVELRGIHVEIDHAVLGAYGWQEINLDHNFYPVPYLPETDRIRYTICEDARLEILRRLSRLNRQRYELELRQAEQEQQARATDRAVRARRGKKPKLGVIQGGLF